MKPVLVVVLALAASFAARADFSYTSTNKTSGGMMGGGAIPDQTSRHFYKGDKMKIDHGQSATIIDLAAQTVTHLDHTAKTYRVVSLSDAAAKFQQTGAEVKIDVQDTGQRKTINGFDSHLVIMTMDMDAPQARRQAAGDMKFRMTMDMWISSDVPGAAELREFYQKNAGRTPWAALLSGRAASDPGMAKAMAELQRKMTTLKGVPVLQVMKMGAAGNDPRMAQAQEQMAQARAKLEEMQKKGGPGAKMAADMLAKMGGGSGTSLFEATIESSNFSAASIPASEFAIPAGYQKTER